jgi:hypothetical protein
MVVRAAAWSSGEEDLEGVAGQQHQVEASIQPDRSLVIEHPGYARAPASLFRQSIARAGSTPTTRQSALRPSAVASIPVPQPRSSIARRPFANHCKSRNPRPSHSQYRKTEPHPDRCNGRCRSFRSHPDQGRLVSRAGTAYTNNSRQHWPKSGIAFPWRTRCQVGDLRAAR